MGHPGRAPVTGTAVVHETIKFVLTTATTEPHGPIEAVGCVSRYCRRPFTHGVARYLPPTAVQRETTRLAGRRRVADDNSTAPANTTEPHGHHTGHGLRQSVTS